MGALAKGGGAGGGETWSGVGHLWRTEATAHAPAMGRD